MARSSIPSALLNAVFTNTREGVAYLIPARNAAGVITSFNIKHVNQNLLQSMLGSTPAKFPPTLHDLIPTLTKQQFADFQKGLNDLIGFEGEHVYQASRRELHVKLRLVRYGEGLLAFFDDISDDKRKEKALAQRDRQYRLLADNISDLVTLHDLDGRFIYASPSVSRILGYEPEELSQQSIAKLVHEEDLPGLSDTQRRLSEEPGGYFTIVYRIRHKEQIWLWMETVASLIVDPQNTQDIYILCTSRDVTERIRYEDHLMEVHQRMAEQAEELRALTEDMLAARRAAEAARQEAEQANRAKSQFLAMMSHELRTPLNAIIGFSEIIQTQVMGPVGVQRYADYAGDIHNAGQHLLSLINDILDLAKIEAGKFELLPELLELQMLVANCVRLVMPRAQSNKITLEHHHLPAKDLHLLADARAVKQMITNLLSNAVKFTPEDGKVTVKVSLRADNGVSIEIQDTGIGISAEDIPKVLLPFGQVHNAYTQQNIGTGLGLPIVKSLIELHNGGLRIESAPNMGTKMILDFPAERTVTAQDLADAAVKTGE